ncbi:hypothetical protein [Streptomyces sp. B6B3]
MPKTRRTDTHTGGATSGYTVKKDKTAVAPDLNGNRAQRRAAEKQARKKK